MNKMILKTLKAVKDRGFDINRETLDNVDCCISLIAEAEVPEDPTAINVVKVVGEQGDTKDTKDTKNAENSEAPGDTGETGEVKEPEVTKEANSSPAIDTPAGKPTREGLNGMEYKDILKEYNLKAKPGWGKKKWIEHILQKG